MRSSSAWTGTSQLVNARAVPDGLSCPLGELPAGLCPPGGILAGASRLGAAAVRHPAPRPFGCPSPHTVVDMVFERVLEALHSYGALGAVAAGDLDPHAIARKEHGWRQVSAPCAEHPGGCQIGLEPFLLAFCARSCRLLAAPTPSPGLGQFSHWPPHVRVLPSKCQDGVMRWLASAIVPVLEGPPVGLGPALSATPY